MDIAKLLPLLLATQNNNSGGNVNNLNQILPELLKAQSGDNNGLNGMLLNMLSSNFNKQNSGAQNKQTEVQNAELKTQNAQNNSNEPNNYTSIKNYKNFYAPPEYNKTIIANATTNQRDCAQCVNGVYPSECKPAETANLNKKNSAANDANNIKTPFGYTRLY